MSLKKKLTRIFGLLCLAGVVTAVIILTSFNSAKQKNAACAGIFVDFDQQQAFFLDDTEIKDLLVKELGDSLTGDNISRIDLRHVESVLKENVYIENAESFLDMQGDLHIHIVQKQPAIRVINRFGVHYYMTEKAEKFPVNNKFTFRVPVISGNIEEGIENSDTAHTKVLQDAVKIIQFIDQSELWKAQIEQVYVNDENEYELIPMIGDFTIVFGKAEDIENKFAKLEEFLQQGLNYVGWDKFSKIDLSFDDQVVCTKKSV